MPRTLVVGAGIAVLAFAAFGVLWLATSQRERTSVATAQVSPTASLSASIPSDVVLPIPSLTPGVMSSDVTPENTSMTICVTGYTSGRRLDDGRTVRPPESYTSELKVQQIVQYGYTDPNPKDYEEDHLVPLELGGDGYAAGNLWPEPYAGTGARAKDQLENRLHEIVCNGQLGLRAAQQAIATNWYVAYRRYVVGA